jgi:hypothetical protein
MLQRRLHEVLFPNDDFNLVSGTDNRDIFVTTDDNFLKAKREILIGLGARRIMRPDDAVALI